jgi:hypothetical protein
MFDAVGLVSQLRDSFCASLGCFPWCCPFWRLFIGPGAPRGSILWTPFATIESAVNLAGAAMSNAYVTLWTKARCGWLRRVRDRGPLRVIFGGPHTSLPSLVNLRVGDTIFPVWICDGQLRVIARMQIGQLITLSEYLREHLHMEPARLPRGPIGPEFPEQHPELGHRAPLGCIEQVAIGIEGTPFNFERSVSPQDLPLLRFGPKPGKEKPLTGLKDGRLSSVYSFHGHVRRASQQTSKILTAACANS